MTAVQPTGTTSSSPAVTTSSAKGSSLGEDDFLKILVTQLENQDPLNPMDGEQFAAQLAQFSSLEQLIQINSTLSQQASAGGQATAANQTALGASLIGRTIEATGSQMQVGTSADTVSVTVDVGGTGGKAQVQVLDASGNVRCTHDLGDVNGGTQTLRWSNQVNGSPELAPEAKDLSLWKSLRYTINPQSEPVGPSPNLKISEVLHNPLWFSGRPG
jgi:flagellar basal-body rod modification protein FlgD